MQPDLQARYSSGHRRALPTGSPSRKRAPIGHGFAILNQREESRRKNTPALIEDIKSVADSTSLQYSDERIAERLHHRLTRVGLEGIGPGAIDMADHSLRAL